MNLFYQPLIDQHVHYLDAEESRHCVKVLRRQAGDPLYITDGKGFFYDAVITTADPSRCMFTIRQRTEEPPRKFFLHIAISPTKNDDRLEWFIEKAVEFGIDRITLLACEHTERAFPKYERLRKIAVSAMKQSLKAWLPRIEPLTPFGTFVAAPDEEGKFIAHVDPANPVHLKDAAARSKRCLVLIGPEGDFSPQELSLAQAAGFEKVSLGTSRLRTETAGIAACHIINLVHS